MDNIGFNDLIEIIVGISIIAGFGWKLGQIKDEIENDYNKRIDGISEKLVEHDKNLALLKERVGNLHNSAKAKISQLGGAVYDIQTFLQSNANNSNCKFIVRHRDKVTSPGEEETESWTNL